MVFAMLMMTAIAGSTAVAAIAPLPNGANDFNSPGFVVRHAWVKFALIATRPLRGNLSREQEDAQVARFFRLNTLIAEQERIARRSAERARRGRCCQRHLRTRYAPNAATSRTPSR